MGVPNFKREAVVAESVSSAQLVPTVGAQMRDSMLLEQKGMLMRYWDNRYVTRDARNQSLMADLMDYQGPRQVARKWSGE